MESKPSELITVPRSRKLARHRFLGGSNARTITSADEAAMMRRLSHEQNIQCLDVIIGNPPRTRAHTAKSSKAQAPLLAAHWAQVLASPPQRTADRRKFNGLHGRHPEVHESVRRSVAKTLRPLFGTQLSIKPIESRFPA